LANEVRVKRARGRIRAARIKVNADANLHSAPVPFAFPCLEVRAERGLPLTIETCQGAVAA